MGPAVDDARKFVLGRDTVQPVDIADITNDNRFSLLGPTNEVDWNDGSSGRLQLSPHSIADQAGRARHQHRAALTLAFTHRPPFSCIVVVRPRQLHARKYGLNLIFPDARACKATPSVES